MAKYIKRNMPLIRYSTTKTPTVLVGLNPAFPLNVKIDTAPEMTNIPIDEPRSNHTDCLVPSSYS